MFASAVSAPIFFGVAKTLLPNFSFSSVWQSAAMSVTYFRSVLSARAFSSSASFMTSLRAVFTRHPPAGMRVSRSYPIDPLVSAVAGICSEMKLHSEYIFSSVSAGLTPSSLIFSAGTNGSKAITSMPRAFAFAATSLPTFPYACMPTFLPRSSLPVPGVKQLRDMYIIIARASSATALEFCPGVFITTMPLSVQASRQMLS